MTQMDVIESKVTEVWNILGRGGAANLVKRVEKIESSLFSGSGAGIVINSAAIAEILRSTNFVTGVSGWQIQKSGNVEFQNGTFRGAVTATSGSFTGVVYVGTAADRIIIDGTTKVIRSESFVAGSTGWQIDYAGNAEFNNVFIRGEIRSAVFTQNQLAATAGSQVIVKSAGVLLSDVTTVASPTTFNVDIADPVSGHTQLFAAGDILRLKSATLDDWLTISSVSDQTTFWRYVCTLSNGTAGTFKAGEAVLDYGPSGAGGIMLTADATGAPYVQVFTHAGSPWATLTSQVRMGNLNGWGPVVTDTYGFGLGDYAGGNYFYYNPTTGNSILSAGDGNVVIDAGGVVFNAPATQDDRQSIIWKNTGGTSVAQLSALDTGDVGFVSNSYVYAQTNDAAQINLQAMYNGGTGTDGSYISVRSGYKTATSRAAIWLYVYDHSSLLHSYTITGVAHAWKVADATTMTLKAAGLQMQEAGATVDEFSTDGTLAGDSDTALPTEKAVKTYVDVVKTPFQRLFGVGVPAATYQFTRRNFVANNFTSNIAGFEDSQGSPYSFGGSPGGFSLSVPANSYSAASNAAAHFLFLFNYHATSPLYLQWTSSTAKNNLTLRWAVVPNFTANPTGDILTAEVRFWAVQSPGAGDNYWALRFNHYGTTYPDYKLQVEIRRGTGVTFGPTDGTQVARGPYLPGVYYHTGLTVDDTGGNGRLTVAMNIDEGFPGFSGGNNQAGFPTSFKTVQIYIPAANYAACYIDDVTVS